MQAKMMTNADITERYLSFLIIFTGESDLCVC